MTRRKILREAEPDLRPIGGIGDNRRGTIMSLFHLTMKHGRTQDEARAALGQAVRAVQDRFGPLVRRVDWDADRSRVRVEGTGFWVEMKVDAQEVHASGDIPILGGLLGGSVGSGIKQIVKQAFEKGRPGRPLP